MAVVIYFNRDLILKTKKGQSSQQTVVSPGLASSPDLSPETSVKDDETAGWKTYTNNNQKFSIKYPSSWSIKETPIKGEGIPANEITLEIKSIDTNDILIDTYGFGLGTKGDIVPVQTANGPLNITIPLKNGVPELQTVNVGLGMLIRNDEQINFIIHFKSPDEKIRAKDWTVIRQILSTFQFLN